MVSKGFSESSVVIMGDSGEFQGVSGVFRLFIGVEGGLRSVSGDFEWFWKCSKNCKGHFRGIHGVSKGFRRNHKHFRAFQGVGDFRAVVP